MDPRVKPAGDACGCPVATFILQRARGRRRRDGIYRRGVLSRCPPGYTPEHGLHAEPIAYDLRPSGRQSSTEGSRSGHPAVGPVAGGQSVQLSSPQPRPRPGPPIFFAAFSDRRKRARLSCPGRPRKRSGPAARAGGPADRCLARPPERGQEEGRYEDADSPRTAGVLAWQSAGQEKQRSPDWQFPVANLKQAVRPLHPPEAPQARKWPKYIVQALAKGAPCGHPLPVVMSHLLRAVARPTRRSA
jgi:hypothetical protein